LATDGKGNMATRTMMTKWISSQLVLHDFMMIFRFTAGYIEGKKELDCVYFALQEESTQVMGNGWNKASREETTRKMTSIYKWATQLWMVYTLHLKKEQVCLHFAFNEETLQVVCTGWTMAQQSSSDNKAYRCNSQ